MLHPLPNKTRRRKHRLGNSRAGVFLSVSLALRLPLFKLHDTSASFPARLTLRPAVLCSTEWALVAPTPTVLSVTSSPLGQNLFTFKIKFKQYRNKSSRCRARYPIYCYQVSVVKSPHFDLLPYLCDNRMGLSTKVQRAPR